MIPARGESALRRDVGVWLGVFIVVNATIGTGIFKTPAKIARLSGSLEAFLLVWVAGGVIAVCGALSLAELAAAVPRTGGIYEYLRRTYGRAAAFLFGWTTLALLIPSAVGSFAKLSAEAIASLLGLAPDPRRDGAVAAGVLVACAAANLAGVRASATAQSVIAAAKYAGVALLAIVGLTVPLAAGASVAVPADAPTFNAAPTLAGCFTALVSVMWAYDGWADLSRMSGEVRDPGRTLPRALLLGTLAICAVYLLANAGYARTLGIDGLRRSTTGENMAAANLAALTLGAVGRQALSALILVSCLGACMTTLLTAPRVFVPMATDGLFVRGLGAVSARTAVPTRAIIVSALVGAAYVAVRSFEQLTDAFVVGFFPFYMLSVAAVFILRRREPELPRPFRVPGYPVIPVVFLVGASALLVGAVLDADRTALFAFAVMVLGFPVRWIWARSTGAGGAQS